MRDDTTPTTHHIQQSDQTRASEGKLGQRLQLHRLAPRTAHLYTPLTCLFLMAVCFLFQRAVLCSAGKAIEMSHDHKPAREDERARIEKLGGKVIHYGTWRVQGVLAVSRAFGDRRLKTYVSAEPEVKQWQLQDGDEFLILASDGVWDVLSSQAAVDIVRAAMQESRQNGNGLPDVKEAARRLTNAAYSYHSMDNITSLVIDLNHYQSTAYRR